MQLVHLNCLELQAVSLALKIFLPFLTGQHVHQNGQHHGSGIHKQTTGAVLRSSAHVGTQTDRVEQLSPIITESNACAGHSQPGSRFAVQGKSSGTGKVPVRPVVHFSPIRADHSYSRLGVREGSCPDSDSSASWENHGWQRYFRCCAASCGLCLSVGFSCCMCTGRFSTIIRSTWPYGTGP